VNPTKFLTELKRRNVYKVAVAYIVVAWLLIQAASIFFPVFDAPPWAIKIFIIVIVLGFPVALVLSWAFEITPGGIKLESEVAPDQSIRRRTGRKQRHARSDAEFGKIFWAACAGWSHHM
jgi:hypothetical protein